MSRGLLGDVVLAELSKKLPDLESLSETILTLSPVFEVVSECVEIRKQRILAGEL